MIEIVTFVLGPLENNNYLLVEPESKTCVVVDPGLECQPVSLEIQRRGLNLQAIWITHGHFDHFAGVSIIQANNPVPVPVWLHPMDQAVWRIPAWAAQFGRRLETPPLPDMAFEDNQILMLGNESVEVRHAPGHSAGHVMFYLKSAGALLCGDVIFQNSIGRTDLEGGDYATLIRSIRSQVLTLPDETRLLPGHGPETTVGEEKQFNPFLQ